MSSLRQARFPQKIHSGGWKDRKLDNAKYKENFYAFALKGLSQFVAFYLCVVIGLIPEARSFVLLRGIGRHLVSSQWALVCNTRPT